METLPGDQTLPPGVLLRDLSDRELRREAEDDRDYWEAQWDDAHRFAEENERGE